jgi:hypothetical protein
MDLMRFLVAGANWLAEGGHAREWLGRICLRKTAGRRRRRKGCARPRKKGIA